MIDADAVVAAMCAVIEGSAGSVRTVPSGTLEAGVYEGLHDEAIFAQAQATPRYHVELPPPERTRDVGPSTANVSVLALRPVVVLSYGTAIEINEAGRRATRSLAFEHLELVARALTWPGNLPGLGLVSDAIKRDGEPEVIRADWRNRIYQVRARFLGRVKDSQPVS